MNLHGCRFSASFSLPGSPEQKDPGVPRDWLRGRPEGCAFRRRPLLQEAHLGGGLQAGGWPPCRPLRHVVCGLRCGALNSGSRVCHFQVAGALHQGSPEHQHMEERPPDVFQPGKGSSVR